MIMDNTMRGLVIGLATALIGVLLTQTHTIDVTGVGRGTVVQCNR
ncbi:hypothetical protein [Dactylosporangium sp. NPDC051541]